MPGELFQNGKRKYLTAGERVRFLAAADEHPRAVRTLCAVLAFSGCRISEATALTVDRVDLNAGTLVFESLKKRRRGVFRAVPVPPSLLKDLDNVHGVRELQARADRGAGVRLWAWSRITAWRNVCDVMDDAGLSGLHATPWGRKNTRLRRGCGTREKRAPAPRRPASAAYFGLLRTAHFDVLGKYRVIASRFRP